MSFEDFDPHLSRPGLAVLTLFLVRSILLWFLVVPLGCVMWIVGRLHWRKRQVRFAQLLGWLDLNLVAALDRVLFWWLKGPPFPWHRFSEIPSTVHKVGMGDFA